jgi:hypothetical protein
MVMPDGFARNGETFDKPALAQKPIEGTRFMDTFSSEGMGEITSAIDREPSVRRSTLDYACDSDGRLCLFPNQRRQARLKLVASA